MALSRCVCLLLCVWGVCAGTELEHELDHLQLTSQMTALKDKLDTAIQENQETRDQMRALQEDMSSLLQMMEECGSCKGQSTIHAPPITATTIPIVAVDDSWRDEVAQGACTAMMPSAGWMFAVRRECHGTKTCAQICSSLAGQDSQVTRGTHPLERGLAPSDMETLGIKIYRYNSCIRSGCGPNFCCCQGN